MADPGPSVPAEASAAIRALRAEVASALATIDVSAGIFTAPDTDRVHLGGSPPEGWTWLPCPKWSLQVPASPDPDDPTGWNWIYVHTAQSPYEGDVTPLTTDEARALARALLSAADVADRAVTPLAPANGPTDG